MSDLKDLKFIDNPAATANPEKYIERQLDCRKVFSSWSASLYSFEWITADGDIKHPDELSETEQAKRVEIEKAITGKAPLEKPIMGIGVLDCIEIGSGRAVFLTLYHKGLKSIPAHIPKSDESDFKAFLAHV